MGPAVVSEAGATGNRPDDTATTDAPAPARELDVLDALPGLWVDHEPQEIATGLMGVLVSVLQLEGVYVRFDASDGGPGIEEWRPAGPSAPEELLHVLVVDHAPVSGIATWKIERGATGALHVVGFRLDLPWESGLVLTSTKRIDFPTTRETRLLRVAVPHAAIAIHAARRLSRERHARAEAEHQLARQNELLRSLVDEVEPSLRSLSRRLHEASQQISKTDGLKTLPEQDAGAGNSTSEEPGGHVFQGPVQRSPGPLTRPHFEGLRGNAG